MATQIHALPIDHLVINVRYDMDAAQHAFKRLGFTLTPRGRHSMGSINHLMIFDQDYIELIGLPNDGGVLRDELLTSPVGIEGLVFQTKDAEKTHEVLSKKGHSLLPVQSFSRPVELDGQKLDASFKTVRFTPGQFPAGRLYFCQHFTPELVWRTEWQAHNNQVTSIAALLIVSEHPKKDAEQYASVSGGKVVKGAHGEFRIAGENYALVFVTQDAYEKCFGPLVCDGGGRPSYFGAIALKTKNLDALRKVLEHANAETSHLRWRDLGDRIALNVPGFNTLFEFFADMSE